MNLRRIMSVARIDSPLRLTVSYALFGMSWIVISDGLMAWGSGEAAWSRLLDSLKGLVFVGITAALLYGLVQRMLSRHQATERALRASEQRLALVLEGSELGYFDHNIVTGEAIVSDTYARMLGYDPAGFREDFESVCRRMHPSDLEPALQKYRRHLAGETDHHSVEYRLRSAAGGWRWILARGRVVERDPAGRPLRLVGTHTDITERKQAEAHTADALSFAKAVLHHAPVGIISYGPDGRAEIANECAARMLGADVPGLLRQNFRELESWRKSGLLDAANRALASGESVVHQASVRTTFGRTLHMEAHLVPFEYQGDRHLLTLLADETVQRRTLENLHLLHAALQASPSAWVVTDSEGVIEWINPAFTRITGYAADEVVGQNPRVLRSGHHAPEFYRQFWDTIRRGEVWSGELCNRRKDGGLYDEHMTVAPVKDPDGAIRHFVAIKEDVTERKRLEQQVTRTQRLESIGLLASGIAHDLNNVLTPILLSVELLKSRFPGPEARKYLETVETAAQRGAGIVRQVLTFARGVDGGERVEVEPKYLLKDIAQLIEETFPRNIRIRYKMATGVHAIRGDLTQLHQVILNLAVNARDAMPQGGILELSAHNQLVETTDPARPGIEPGPHVVLAVADSGTGIAPEVLEHMFEPFYTTKPRGKGTGLGLSTVYGIVRSHGGIIEVRTQLGQGTTFEVLLPAVPAKVAVNETDRHSVALLGRGRRVLVVDDEESIRRVLSQLLSRRGFVPVAAVDGADGLHQFRQAPHDFSAAIIDMMMPRMNGAALTRAIREISPHLPIIISTGLLRDEADSDIEEDLRGLGVRTFLHKPYAEDGLIHTLAAELGADAPAQHSG